MLINDYGPPSVMFYQMVFSNLSEIEDSGASPMELISDARTALKQMQQQEEPEPQQMIGIPQTPQEKETPIVGIRPKKKKGKLKTEAELKALSDAMLNADIHVPVTKDNYFLSVGIW